MRIPHALFILFAIFSLVPQASTRGHAQAALLLQDADGVAELLSPTGHSTVYFARICAASPTRLRRCGPGELGVVIGRYTRIGGYDWVAMPLIPYLYSVEDRSQVPEHVNREIVQSLRVQYHDAHLTSMGRNLPEGGGMRKGWNQLVGAAYERRIYAFRFETTEAQDDAFIAKMNAEANRSHFNILFRNCANFSGAVLDFYFPHTFKRHIVPDFGIVTPRQMAYELARYARKHPEIQLAVMEIPLIPGNHRSSRLGKSVAESLVVSGYVIPIALASPYAAGAIVADSLAFGRFPLNLEHAQILSPETIAWLATPAPATGALRPREGEAGGATVAVENSAAMPAQ